MINVSKYDHIIGYGIGQNYEKYKYYIKDFKLDYLMDRRWESMDIDTFDDIKIIREQEAKTKENVLVIVFPHDNTIVKELREKYSCDICKVHEVINVSYSITGKELRNLNNNGVYSDSLGNVIEYDETISENITVFFFGGNNRVHLGRCITANNVFIKCGECGSCVIEDNSSFEGLHIETSFGNVTIESDCMFSNNIIIRNHDNHHIFDLITGKRINNSREVIVKKQVWIGEGVVLLPGANIGIGSIVAERAVTSSVFPDHVIIAGSPAKVIRENICWSRDNTFYFNRNSLDECLDQNAKKYL